MPSIFISYRREDASPYAGRLYDHLSARFGADRVFMDIDTIRPGDDFVQVISDRVAACDVLIAIIGKRWASCVDARGVRRLDDPGDYVRLEIASALNRNVRVIPALVDGAQMPGPQDLPRDLTALARRNAIEITNLQFRYNVGLLIQSIEQTVGRKTPFFGRWKPPVQPRPPQVAPPVQRTTTSIRINEQWPIYLAGAGFLIVQLFMLGTATPYPASLIISSILEAAVLFLVLRAAGKLQSVALKLAACWLPLAIFWMLASTLVLRPLLAQYGSLAVVNLAYVFLQAAAAVLFGFLGRLALPAIPVRAIWALARVWGLGRLAIWIVVLVDPGPARFFFTIFTALEGGSAMWLLRKRS